ncbi:hypothetical protein HDV05_001458, partial [Chytridiales sp. JEL 0842]
MDDENLMDHHAQSQGYAATLPHVNAKAPKEDFLRRVDKSTLPRATAYCTANAYKMDLLMDYLLSRKAINGTSPRRFDEAMYTPYLITPLSPPTDLLSSDVSDLIHPKNPLIPSLEVEDSSVPLSQTSMSHRASFSFVPTMDGHLQSGPASATDVFAGPSANQYIDVDEAKFFVPSSPRSEMLENWEAFVKPSTPDPMLGTVNEIPSVPNRVDGGMSKESSGLISDNGGIYGGLVYKDLVRKTTVPELFFFDYGVVVMWGFTEEEELQILEDIEPFEEESIDLSDVEAEKFHYLYSRQQQARIYNDIITLITPNQSMMIKLAIAHAFAQSVKLTLFEGLIEETIESTQHIPTVMSETGKIHMNRKAINQKIGQ